MKLWVVSAILIKDFNGCRNFSHQMMLYKATSGEEAIGKAIIQFTKALPEHSLLMTPICGELRDNKLFEFTTTEEEVK